MADLVNLLIGYNSVPQGTFAVQGVKRSRFHEPRPEAGWEYIDGAWVQHNKRSRTQDRGIDEHNAHLASEGWHQLADHSWVKMAPDVGVPGKGLTLPGSDHIGPGNDIIMGAARSGADQVAKDHDIAYHNIIEFARQNALSSDEFRNMISSADQTAIDQFNKEISETKTWQAYVGKYGLKIKKAFEDNVKHVYPQQPKQTSIFGLSKAGTPLTRDQWTYKLKLAASNKFRNIQDNTERDRKKNDYIKSQHDDLRVKIGDKEYHKHFNQYGAPILKGESVSSTKSSDNDANKQTAETEKQVEKDQVETDNDEFTKDDEPELNKAVDDAEEQQPNMAPTNKDEHMEVDQTGASASSQGGRSMGGGSTSPQVLQFYKASGFHANGNRASYNNGFRLRSWGNGLFKSEGNASAAVRNEQVVVTPMVDLPVDYLWFYIPMEAVDTLPLGTKIKGVKIKVTPIGQMVSFNTNASTTSSGSTSHTLYGMAQIGLNKIIPTQRMTITRDTTSPMKLASATKWKSETEWITRLWGHNTSAPLSGTIIAQYPTLDCAANHEIIVPNTYCAIIYPTPPSSVADSTYPDDMQISSSGQWNINHILTKFPMQPHTGKPIINYDFNFREDLFLKPRNTYTKMRPGTSAIFAGCITQPAFMEYTQADKDKIGPLQHEAVEIDNSIVNRERTINNGNLMNSQTRGNRESGWRNFNMGTALGFQTHKKETDIFGMPSVTFGIEAVQANIPEASTSTYINASCDYWIETEIEFEFHIESHFNWGDARGQNFFLNNNLVNPNRMGQVLLGYNTEQLNVPLIRGLPQLPKAATRKSKRLNSKQM